MRRFMHPAAFLFLAALLGALSGCRSSNDRQEVSGQVLLKNKPLEDGIIQFEPLDGQQTGDGAPIVNGQYVIPKEKGLAPGKYRVMLIAGAGRTLPGDASPDSPYLGLKPGQERIPPKYNVKSEIVKVVTREGPNTFDFDIH